MIALFAAFRVETYLLGEDSFSVLKLVGWYFFAVTVPGAVYYWNTPSARSRSGYTEADLLLAGALLVICWIAVTFGYLSISKSVSHRLTDFTALSRDVVPIRLGIVFCVGWLARGQLIASGRYLHVATDDSALQSGRDTFLVNTAAAWPTFIFLVVLWLARHAGSSGKVWVFAMFASEVVWALSSGARTSFVGLLLAALVVQYYSRGRRVPAVQLVAAAMIALIAFPLILVARSSPGDQAAVSASNTSLIASAPQAVVARFVDSDAIASAIHRQSDVADVMPFSRFAELTASAVVPRLLWATKPDAFLVGNEFGRKSATIASNDMRTSINLPLPLMWFLTGGMVMLLVGGCATGVLMRLMNDVLLSRAMGPLTAAIFGLLAINIVTFPATILPAGFLAVVKEAGTLLVLALVVTKREELENRVA